VPDPRVAAIVVTYFPDHAFPERLERLLAQVARVVIVDNGSNESTLGWATTYGTRPALTILRNAANFGIATALNQGMQALVGEGYEWVLTSDQDSVLVEGCIAALLATASANPASAPVALVGANRQEAGGHVSAHRWLRPRRAPPFFERVTCDRLGPDGVTLVITSGTLMNVAAFRQLGPFIDDFFIDLVDFEYCLRARKAGYRILVSCAARILHRVGAKTQAQVAGVTLTPTHHSPLRKYYLFRNAVKVICVYGATFPHWLLYQLAALLEILVGIVFLEERKLIKLKACAAGLWDGLLGRMGATQRRF
jgi:rhamnosyltransferase